MFRELFTESGEISFYAPDGNDYIITGKNAGKFEDFIEDLFAKQVEDEGMEYGDDDAMDYLSDDSVLKELFKYAEKKLKVKVTPK